MRIWLDAGHGGKDSGAVGGGLREKDIALDIVLELGKLLESSGIEVGYTRKDDTFVPIKTSEGTTRMTVANKWMPDLFISIHCNAAANISAKGLETFSYPGSSKGAKLSEIIYNQLVADNLYTLQRGTKTANFAVLKWTNCPACLIETAFISNAEDRNILIFKKGEIIQSIYRALMNYLNLTNINLCQDNKNLIEGNSVVQRAQMKNYLIKYNKNPKINCSVDDLIDFYIKEAEIEGIRADIAFAQAIKETGFFKFGGDVTPEQNNYAGIGTTGGGVKGAYFESSQVGIRAQIQHLKAYCNKKPLIQAQVDPRFHLVTRGIAPCVENLNGRWAVPGKGYGESIMKIVEEMKKMDNQTNSDVSEWAEESWKWAIKNNITDGSNPKKNCTREEVITMIRRALKNGKNNE